jgi:hypothetical protein
VITTQQSPVGTARRTADSVLSRYRDLVTTADESRRRALIGQDKMAKAQKAFKEGQAEFAAALYDLHEAGLSGGQIAREFEISPTHALNTIRMEKLRRAAAG